MKYLIVNEIITAQTPGVVKPFKKILSKFDRIIEIGTYKGGFTLWLFKNVNPNVKIISYDINKNYREQSIIEKIDFRIGNCFKDRFYEITNLINDSGRVLLLCDGGDKEREFNSFSKYLKENDVIMLHDYCENINDFNLLKQKLNWPTEAEAFYENIKDTIQKNNLIPYMYEDFKSVLWGSFKKGED